jgi:citrate lyase subunit beta / citryl-CoA lyase
MKEKILRSALYMPGSNLRAMEKAKNLPCDAVVFDLEDAVAPDVKVLARQQVIAQVQAGGYGHRQLVVRANSIDTPWGEADLLSLAEAGIETVCLPKVESAEQLQRSRDLLARGRSPEDVSLWGMIETPQGVHKVEEIASSCPQLQALLMGTTDLAKELRVPVRADRLGLQYALSKCVNACRMAGIVALDSVFLDIKDSEAFRADCEHGLALGFDGKTLIHPSQVKAANEIYGLSAEQIDHSRQVIDAWQAAEAEGKGVAVLDNKLIETMHVDEARRILALSDSLQQLEQ